ncbi:MAG: filamentous hemagglutinin N-terminal domain-containing protein [Nitrospira sp. CR1.3]|nr:filamentous hemagglutinin N-terminal domain-containing protein [Nitrospira sp. CR1.3]
MRQRTVHRRAIGIRSNRISVLYRTLCVLAVSFQILLPSRALALPSDGKVVGGSATIQQSNPNTLNIQQSTDKAILNWQSFSIGAHEAVRFVQPSVRSIALNRVVGADPSVILGQLQANGRIFLVNPNGILFGAGAQIDVGGLLATTLQIRDSDFMAGRFLFAQDPLKALRTVVNRGTINVSDHGFVFLVAPGVSNEGLIIANLGNVVLGSAQKLTVDLMGDGLINYALSGKVLDQVTGIDGKPLSSAVSNNGTIQADGGRVILSAKASGDIFSSVVNQSGVIRAQSLVNHAGEVRLEGSDPVANTGTIGWQANLGKVQNADGVVLNTGTIDVSAAQPGAAQGQVTVTGEKVGVGGSIIAKGADAGQGGRVLISSTENTVVTQDGVIDTSGVGNSNAGNVVVWSDKNTLFGGSILAQGGAVGGNGGQIEVSGHENLGFFGSVNALAPKGATGNLLLDPANITVATGGGATLAQVDQFGDTPAASLTIAPATINAAAANVTLQANNDITVTNAIAMTNNGVGITMQAGRDINVNAAVSTNNGNISMTANDSSSILANRANGAAGDIIFAAGANLSAGTGNINLTIDPATAGNYAPGSITTVRNLTTTTGNITLSSPNTVTLSGAVNAGSGTVTINANTDGAGAQNFTMNAGSSIATTNTGANAVQIIVNDFDSGTGAASLRGSITTGNGGTATITTRGLAVGGNTTGGAITQGAVLTMNAGAAGTVSLATGAAASSITLNTVGNDFIGTVGVSRAFNVALRDANALALGASTISGTLGVTTAGAVTQTGALAVTGTTTLAAGAANNITLNNAGNNFSTVVVTNGNNVALTDANALALGASTISGTLNVTTNGALTQSGVLNVTGTTTLAAGAGNDINLSTSANNFSTVGVTSGNNVSLRDTNALILGASTISGNLALTTGGALTQSGVLAVTGTTSFTATAANTDILLGTQANNLGGALSFAGTLANFRDLSIRNVNVGATVPALAGLTALRNLTLTFDNAPVTLPALTLTAGGNLNVTAGGAITDTGNLIVPGTTTLAAGANNITLDNANNFTGAVSVTSGNNVALNDINALVLGASTISGTLGVTTNGALTQSGALNVTGVTTLAAGAANNITLNNAANNFSTVGITSGNNVAVTDANALILGASTISGTLNVTTSGALTQSGALAVTGTTTLAAGAANNISLNNAANNFSTVGVTSGNNVAVTDANALILGASTISGTLNVTTNGALTQSGALAVTGTTTLAAGAANNITLNNAANNFSTVGITNGNNVALTDANALNLAASTVSGTLGMTTGGTLSQSGVLNVSGATTFTATAANTDVQLDTQANNFGGALAFAGTQANFRDVSLRNVNAGATVPALAGLTNLRNLTLQFDNAPVALPATTLTAGGNLNVTAGGSITQSGILTVPGTTTLATTVAGSDILLNTQANNFTGAVSFGGTQSNIRDVGLRNVNAGATVPALAGLTNLRNLTLTFNNAPIALPALTLTAGGNLDVTAGGMISQSGALTVPGTTTLATTVAGSDILLDGQANNFGGAVSFGGTLGNIRDVGLRNVNAAAAVPALAGLTNLRNLTLTFDNAPVVLPTLTLTAGGNLNVTAGGAITDTGNLIVPGTTTLIAGANNITLDNANNFTGAVAVVSGNNVTLNDINALDLAASTVSGTLGVTTNGPLTQSGPLAVTGTTTLAAGVTNNITLTNAANNFSTVGITSGNNVSLTDATALDLAASTISGTLNVTTNGALTQSGPLAVTGTTTLAAGAANNITLTNAANNFSTVGITSGNNVNLTDATALDLAASTVSGNLTATAGGLLSQSGALTVAGTASFDTTAAATLGSVTLANSTALTLNTSTVGGNLTASTTAGDLTLPAGQTLTVVGDATLTPAGTVNLLGTTRIGGTQSAGGGTGSSFVLSADTNLNALPLPAAGNITVTTTGTSATFAGPPLLPQAINLGNAGNTFGGPVSVTTAAPAFTGTTTNTYNLTQSAPVNLNVGQSLTVTDLGGTTGTRGNITLTNAANSFETVQFTGGNIAWAETGPVTIGSVSANAGTTSTGTLAITSTGAVTQTGAITAAGATTLAAGAVNNITLNNAANNFATVGITSGNNVSLTDATALTLNASTISGNFSANAGDLTVAGTVASTGGTLNLAATNSVTQLASLTTAGANDITVTTAGGPITMAAAATTTSGTGAINYTAGTGVTLGSLSTGGGVNAIANGGSVFSAVGSGTNVTAGANSTLQAFNGVVGTQASPLTVNVNPGTLSIRATTAIAGISAFINGIVLPGNALTLLNIPPGLVCFNGCPVPPNNNPLAAFRGIIPSFNVESVVPWYLRQPSDPPMISVFATYVSKSVVTEPEVGIQSNEKSVGREIPPCFPASACKPGATLLTTPGEGDGVTAR